MNISKHLTIATIFAALLSIALYCSILFQSFGFMEFQFALFLLYFAQAFLLLFVVFLVCTIVARKATGESTIIKKTCISLVSILLTGCIVLCGYAYLNCYNSYTPENLFTEDSESVQSFYPYHNIADFSIEEKDPINLSVSHIPGTDYVDLYCYDDSISGPGCDYEVEYLNSASPFMLFKFWLERVVPTPFNTLDIDVYAPGERMRVNGESFTAFVNGNNYAVLINSFGSCTYASILGAPEDLTVEDFAREIIKQTDLLDTATEEKLFLDMPLF